jgi:hypothetical protein
MTDTVDIMDVLAFVVTIGCLRCAARAELMSTDDKELEGFVKIGFNLYYCNPCARKTGYTVLAKSCTK